MGRRRAVGTGAVTALLLVAATVAWGPTAASPGAPPADAPVRGNSSLREARTIAEFGVYYAGESVAGLPLAAVERRDDAARYVSFLYGDCRARDHLGCALPLEIQTWPSCARNLSLYDPRDPFAPRPEHGRVRGAPAGILEEGRHLEIQSATSTIVIFGDTRALVSRVAAALRGVNNPDRPGDPLRQPAAGAVEGELACP